MLLEKTIKMDGFQVLDVGDKVEGNIWNRKLLPEKADGKLLRICHTVRRKAASSTQQIRFLRMAVDLSGERIIVADHQGNIFILDLEKNRFWKICNLGVPVTSIDWNGYRINEIFLALSTYELRCYNVVTKELVNVMKCHTSSVHSISIHGSGRYALTSSFDTTVLWDLNTFMKVRTLNGAQQVGVQKVFFLPNSNKIVSCFKDDSIFVWESENMKCLFQLSGPVGKKPGYRCLAATRDSRLLAAGGRSRFLHLWNLDTRQLIQVIELPTKVKEVKEIEFLTDHFAVNQNQLLAVLGQDGILRFIEPHLCKLEAEVGSLEKRIHSFVLSKNMRYAVTLLDNGEVTIHSLTSILRPQGLKPIVNKIKDRHEASTTRKTTKETVDKEYGSLENRKCKKRIEYSEDGIETEPIGSNLNMKRLKAILRGYGEYPAKYRLFIWRSILRLPENHVAFSALVDKGTHNAFATLHEKYPIKSRKLFRVLQRVLSALAYWSPIFGETEYLPMFVFPIVRLFPNNQLLCFELATTILLNWCQKWFEYFPNPPLSILTMIEKLLGYHDPPLLEFFVKLNVSTQIYAWPMLCTLFSEILTKDQWLIVWDNILSNHPSYCLFFITSYLIQSRQTLFSCKSEEDFEFYFHHRNPVDISNVIKEASRLTLATPDDVNPKKVLEKFRAIPPGQYPVFDCYPKFVVDYLVEERERIREEELDYLRQKREAIDLKKQKELTRREELAYYREQQHIIKAEQQRRDLINVEEKKLAEQRKKLQSLRRDIALQELDVLDEVRRKFLHHQRQVKNAELQRLDDELDRKMKQRKEETKTALEDAEIKALELEAQKRNLKEGLLKGEVDAHYRLQMEARILRKQQEEHDEKIQNIIEQTRNIDTEKLTEYQTELAKVEQERQLNDIMSDLDERRKVIDLEREVQALQITRANFDNKMRENELHGLLEQNIIQEQEQLTANHLVTDNLQSSTDSSNSQRGSFTEKELDLMSQVRSIRRRMAQRKFETTTTA